MEAKQLFELFVYKIAVMQIRFFQLTGNCKADF